MAGTINTLPIGLLGFLGLKNGGNYPRAMGEELQPAFELSSLYFGANQRTVRLSGNIAAIGFTPLGTVPQGEYWALTGLQLNSNAALGAGVSLRGFAAAAVEDGAAWSVIPLTPYRAMTVGEVFVSESDWVVGHKILPAGASLGFFCTLIAAGPVAVAWQAQFAPMET